MVKHLDKVFKATVIVCFEEGTFLDSHWGSNTFSGKVIFIQCLDQLSTGSKFIQMEENQSLELVIEGHLQRTVPSGLKFFFQSESFNYRSNKHLVCPWFSTLFISFERSHAITSVILSSYWINLQIFTQCHTKNATKVDF